MKNIIHISKTSKSIQYLFKKDKNFKILYKIIGKINYSLITDYYGFIIETIIGQMLSNKVSEIITERLRNICINKKININSIKTLSLNKLMSIGISRKKAQCIIDFTKFYSKYKFTKNKLSKLSDDEIIKIITSIKGLGIWSAKMFLLFVLGRENIIPYEDTAYLQAFLWYYNLNTPPSKTEMLKICEKWSPYNSIIARYFYIALDNGLTKTPFSTYT